MRKMKNMIGWKFNCNSGGEFVVEEFLGREKDNYFYKIRFVETGATKIVERRNMVKGSVRDNYRNNIFGVARKGETNSTWPRLNKLAYKRWYAMIERCYNEKAFSYQSYGAKGVRVSDRWLCFSNFFDDLKSIDGYDEKKYMEGKIQLDKDKLFENNKIYGLNTCRFVERHENAEYQPSKRKAFIAISPNGDEIVYSNQNECARENGLTARTIGKVLNNQLKTHKGWRFKYI